MRANLQPFRPSFLVRSLRAGAALLLLLGWVGRAPAATWIGASTGNWTDPLANNWGLGVGVYPGDGANSGAEAKVFNATVTISTNLPSPVGSSSFVNAVWWQNATINIQGNIAVEAYFKSGDNATTVINHSSGTFSSSARTDIGVGTGGSSTYNLSGSAIGNMTTTDFRFGMNGSTGIVTLKDNAQLTINKIAMWNRGTFRLSGNSKLLVQSDGAAMTANSALDIAGNATVAFKSLTAAGSLMLRDISNPVTITNLLSLTAATDLYYQPAAMTAGSATLFSYGSLNGTFATVNVAARSTPYTGVFTDIGDLSPGEYYLEYGGGSNDSIVLYFGAGVIPEPGTMMLIVLGGLGLFGWRTLRANEERRTRRRSAGWA